MSRLVVLAIGLWVVFAPIAHAAEADKPRLVVLIVFDQMRGDYLMKWKPYFGKDGFNRLLDEGAWYQNCHYPYAITQTGPGHASILTGCGPDVHGIIGNNWYERESRAAVNCSESARYDRVPASPKTLPKEEVHEEFQNEEPEAESTRKKAYGTADRLLAPTFGDALKTATGGKARVIGLSFKDRSAVLPVGPKADAAYWLDNTDGMVVTSTAFRAAVHPWVADFNKKRLPDQWFGTKWTHLRTDLDYAKIVGPDKQAGEGKGARQGITFPHRTDGGLKKPGKTYYEALYNSPFGNDFLLELVKVAVEAENLGQDEVPDLLTVSFSSNDAIGHCWGPDSQEALDVTLRSDRTMAQFLKFLDDKVGKGKYVVCLTADHGICPLPEVAIQRGNQAGRTNLSRIIVGCELALRDQFAQGEKLPNKLMFLEGGSGLWFYLNHEYLANRKIAVADAARVVADVLVRFEGIGRSWTRADLEKEPDPYDAVGRRMRKAYHPARSGDVGLVLKPYWIDSDGGRYLTGTTHGSPYEYDTHVPLVIYGPGVKPGVRPKQDVVPAMIAAIFAKALNVPKPAKAEYEAPAGLFEK